MKLQIAKSTVNYFNSKKSPGYTVTGTYDF
jgi:hypothetical protein